MTTRWAWPGREGCVTISSPVLWVSNSHLSPLITLLLCSVELGVVGAIGTLYPTTGFSAAYILAHEVGHTLGMKHDGIEDGCDWSGFIMSRSRGKHGQTKWSPCSQDKLRSYQATGK